MKAAIQSPPNIPKSSLFFLETKGTAPEWTKAWIDKELFTLIPIILKGNSVIVGKRKSDDQRLVMAAKNGNKLMEFELAPAKAIMSPPQPLKPGEMLLEGTWKGKPFYYKISKVIELASPEYQ